MHGASELQIPAEAYSNVVEAAFLAMDRQQIGKRLRRMIMAAVSGINDRDI